MAIANPVFTHGQLPLLDKNGDNYDCVDMYKQPAFDHPLLKNHSDKIRLSLQARQRNAISTATKLSKLRLNECPSGTVLIKRTKKVDLIRDKNKKYVHYFHPKNTKEVIEADGTTFSDGYKRSCLNYECGSFIQVSKKVSLAQPIPGDVARINMYATKVIDTGDWSLNYKLGNDYEEVGFWPQDVFNNMDDVKLFEVGGIAFSPFSKPSPTMGNGVLPTDKSPGARIDHAAFWSQSGFYVATEESVRSEHETASDYCTVSNSKYEDNGFKFEYGGPGGSTGR